MCFLLYREVNCHVGPHLASTNFEFFDKGLKQLFEKSFISVVIYLHNWKVMQSSAFLFQYFGFRLWLTAQVWLVMICNSNSMFPNPLQTNLVFDENFNTTQQAECDNTVSRQIKCTSATARGVNFLIPGGANRSLSCQVVIIIL